MSNRPPSNARDGQPIVRFDIAKFMEAYTRHEKALQEIAAIPASMTPQMQNITMRAIAKKALGL